MTGAVTGRDGMKMIDVQKLVQVDETKCSEVNNCLCTSENDGIKYCMGCGSVVIQNNEKNENVDEVR